MVETKILIILVIFVAGSFIGKMVGQLLGAGWDSKFPHMKGRIKGEVELCTFSLINISLNRNLTAESKEQNCHKPQNCMTNKN